MDAAAHLDECGSLLTVSSEDLEAVARDLASLAGEETIFGGLAAEKLKRLQAELEPLSRRYDVVVANPPYMGEQQHERLGSLGGPRNATKKSVRTCAPVSSSEDSAFPTTEVTKRLLHRTPACTFPHLRK